MSEQLEFDLVLLEPGWDLETKRLLDEAAVLTGQAKEKQRLAKIAAELRRVDLPMFIEPTNELEEMRLRVGPANWKKTRRHWQRRLKQNFRAFRKVLIVLRHFQQHELSKQTDTEL